jgi:ankyrin repeat protein
LDKNSSTHTRDIQGRLPVHLAAWRGDWDLIEMVSSQKDPIFDLSSTDYQGRTGMHFAASSGKDGIVDRLLENKADCNVLDGDGWTPLHWACRQSDTEVIKSLLSHGADHSCKSQHGWTPKHVAIFHSKKEVLSLLASWPESASVDTGSDAVQNDSNEDPADGVNPPSQQGARHIRFSCDGCFCVSIRGDRVTTK